MNKLILWMPDCKHHFVSICKILEKLYICCRIFDQVEFNLVTVD